MKKPICKLLARVAKDGDVETVAEFIEEMISAENEAQGKNADPVAIAVAHAEPAPGETENEETPIADEDPLAQILEKLDRLIALLTPAAPTGDSDLAETISEVIEEAVENAAEPETPAISPETVAEVVSEILEPEAASEPEETDCGTKQPACSADTLRAVLLPLRPVLAKLPKQERRPFGRPAS